MAIVELKTAREITTAAVKPEQSFQKKSQDGHSKFQKMMEEQQEKSVKTASQIDQTQSVKAASQIDQTQSVKDVAQIDKTQSVNPTAQIETQLEQLMQASSSSQAPKMKAISADGLNIDPSKIDPKDQIQTTNKIESVFSEVNRGQLQMENMMEMVTSGQKFSGPELLSIQAGIYSIVLEMELTAKAVEQVNNAHNTVWKTQIS